jgi:hypothetical protein
MPVHVRKMMASGLHTVYGAIAVTGLNFLAPWIWLSLTLTTATAALEHGGNNVPVVDTALVTSSLAPLYALVARPEVGIMLLMCRVYAFSGESWLIYYFVQQIVQRDDEEHAHKVDCKSVKASTTVVVEKAKMGGTRSRGRSTTPSQHRMQLRKK